MFDISVSEVSWVESLKGQASVLSFIHSFNDPKRAFLRLVGRDEFWARTNQNQTTIEIELVSQVRGWIDGVVYLRIKGDQY